jgi:peptide/nickel transport system permease protein
MSTLAWNPVTVLRRRSRDTRMPSKIILASFAFVAAGIVCAVAGRWLAPYPATQQNLFLGVTNPSSHHWLGTDTLGRDVLSRVIVGARTAMIGPAVIAVGAMLIGNILGTLAGYWGGLVDTVIMRWVDLMYSLPGLLVAIVVVGVVGGGYWAAVALLVVLTSPYDARVVRGATLEQRPRPYVEAVRVLGVPARRIMFRHIWPNVFPVVVANTFLNFAFSLVSLSALSYLGLGVSPGTPDWGRMIADNRSLLLTNPVADLGAACALVLTASAINLIGDWSYETLSDRGRAR